MYLDTQREPFLKGFRKGFIKYCLSSAFKVEWAFSRGKGIGVGQIHTGRENRLKIMES